MRQKAIRFIILLGIVSLLADITYEGARSINGPFLAVLGASGTAVGIIVGIGELLGYGIRVFSGIAADRTQAYWLFTFIGYAINLLAVPLLALAGNWKTAAFLIVLERIGKGLRTPARDTMLSFATKHVGRGFGFGIHEALDQIGAIAGPLIVAAVLFYRQEYTVAFAALAIPAVSALGVLTYARFTFPTPEKMEVEEKKLKAKGYPRQFWIYVIAISLISAGFVDFSLLSYHFEVNKTLSPTWIPVFYSFAMAIDGLAAIGIGKIFDMKGIAALSVTTIATCVFAPLIYLGKFWIILIGIFLWGINLGARESIMRSYVAVLIPSLKRSSAYGILYLGVGLFWFIGSALIGTLYDISIPGLIIFSMAAQITGAILLLFSKSQEKTT